MGGRPISIRTLVDYSNKNKTAEHTITDPEDNSAIDLTKYNFVVDFEKTTVTKISADGTKEALSYAHASGDESHGATLSLWPEGSDKTTYNSFVNTKQQVKRSITVTKVWNDDANRDGLRKEVTVHLLRNGEDTGQSAKLGTKDNATATFDDLDTYDLATNTEYEYSISEDVPDGYTAASVADGKGNVTLTNTHAISTVNIDVTKKWEGDSAHTSDRPKSITVALLANGKEAQRVKVEAAKDGSWKTTFVDLPANEAGKAIVYTAQEVDVDSHYTPTISGTAAKGFVITNTYKGSAAAPKNKLATTADPSSDLFLLLASEGTLALSAAYLVRTRRGKRK